MHKCTYYMYTHHLQLGVIYKTKSFSFFQSPSEKHTLTVFHTNTLSFTYICSLAQSKLMSKGVIQVLHNTFFDDF